MPKKSRKQQDPFIKPIESEDKAGLSKDPPQDHPCSVPRGSRVAICAPPGHGKTCLAKHIAVYSRPFAAVVVIHGAGAMTKEWSKTVHTQTNFTQATPEWWAQQSKLNDGEPILCVCDDLNWQDLNPKERTNAYKLVQLTAARCGRVETSQGGCRPAVPEHCGVACARFP